MAKIIDATYLNNGLLACSLDVVVAVFMNTKGPLVPFAISYYPC